MIGILRLCVLYSVLIVLLGLINIPYRIYFMYCSKVLSVQSKPQLGNMAPAPTWSLSLVGRCFGGWGGLCLFTAWEVINGGPCLPANCHQVSTPLSTREYLQRKRKSIHPHWWPHSLYSQTYTHAWIHGKFYTSSQIPRQWHEHTRVDEEWVCTAVVLCLCLVAGVRTVVARGGAPNANRWGSRWGGEAVEDKWW